MKNYYRILGIEKDATADEIKAAYRKLASKHHPDKGGDAETFKEISEAYESLTAKPRQSRNAFPAFTTGMRVKITALEAFTGCAKKIQIGASRIESIQIPAGARQNELLPPFECDNTLFWITVEIDDPEFEVDPNQIGNIYSNIEVSPFMMMSGGFTHFKTVDGATMQVRIPSGIKPLTLLKVKGRGLWKDSRTVSRGDCLLRVVPNVLKPHEYSQEEVDQFLKAREDFKTRE
jgi:DnaJ-class molecular chaperone